MKKLFSLFVIIFVITMSASSTLQLQQPSGFQFNDGALIWNEVENADEYLIMVNGEDYLRNIPYMDGFIQEGQYIIEVIAKDSQGIYLDSSIATYEINIDYDQEAQIELYSGQYQWSEVMLATHYLVTIDFDFYITADTKIDLDYQEEVVFTVQAVFPDGSKTAVFSTETTD